MALSALGRKHLLPHGSQRQIARRHRLQEPLVSAAVNGVDLPLTEVGWRTYRKAQNAIADVLGLTLEEAFQAHELGQIAETELKAS